MHVSSLRPRSAVRPGAAALALALAVVGLPALTSSSSTPGALPAAAAAAPTCSALGATVRERVSPTTQASLLTTSAAAATKAEAAGYTSVRDTSVRAGARKAAGLVAVHRLYRSARGGNYFYSTKAAEIRRAVSALGYTDQGVAFWASPVARSCLVGVTSYHKGGTHRYVTSAADRAALAATGWREEGVRFYLRKAPVDPRFSIAVMPDTQQEVLKAGDGRLAQRSRWLVDQRDELDLRFVSHTGDVVNWDTSDHAQYRRAAAGLAPLVDAGVPTSLSIGNHDTAATCPGGSACDAARTRVLFRRTTTFNRYLGTGPLDQEGAYEAGKVDNTYHVFTAGGASWLVLNLELWPRTSVVSWAGEVVRTHPKHNVIVLTHSYLTGKGGINQTRGGYGDTTGQYLFDHLVGRYANVRMVFSGHVGTAKHRVDRGVNGNRVDSYLLAMHSDTTNPVRLVEVDTQAGTLRTKVYAPWTRKTYTGAGYASTVRGVSWVR
ncbi:metallophosphoesterase [Microlunatus capsulatus]|uniref:Calcineurin-like phosphoesterase n=1 Tax=Microlunatus capsulatus TaxID=99117 RepID=A0ABS4Z613_9ACTN|nr:metallophosphoesterase [Microlunatus capsulatus]MBP2416492.1 hypothetical protein [Microlunatus capsulatus]